MPARKLVTHKIRWVIFKQKFISFLVLLLGSKYLREFILKSKAVNSP